jgi:seryl-tRNA synthetase
MLEIQQLRTGLDTVTLQLAKRGYAFPVEAFNALEAERKKVQTDTQELQAQRNSASKRIGHAKSKGEDVSAIMAEVAHLGDALKQAEDHLEQIQQQLQKILLEIPNLPHESVPEGKDETGNVQIRRWGEPRSFDFAIQDHVSVGEGLGLLDFETAAKLSGARFSLMKGGLARLHRALAQFMLDTHTQEHGYTETYVPYLVNRDSLHGTGQLPKFEEDLFSVHAGGANPSSEAPAADFHLIPTAEVPITNMVRDDIVPLQALPLKFVAHTPCFRSEAGSYGRDTRGLIRQHQFDKVELVHIVHPDQSYETLEQLVGHAEKILQKLALPYRVMACVPETWVSRRQKLMTSKSGCQRRILIAKSPPVAIVKHSKRDACKRAFAMSRENRRCCIPSTVPGLLSDARLVAVLENYQNADGSVSIPEVLRPYMNGLDQLAGLPEENDQ